MTNRNDEIQVRRRDGVPMWAWLVALALIALLVWWLLTMNSGTTPPPTTTPTIGPSIQAPSASPAATTSPDVSAAPTAS